VNHRHEETLKHLFKTPIDRNIDWWKIEHLLEALGAELVESGTSRVKVVLMGQERVFSRPHHRHETNIQMVKAVRQFLEEIDLTPEHLDQK